MREKQYVCAIEPYQNGLLLTTLNYQHEIRPLKDVAALSKPPKLTKDEVALAQKLIKQMTKKRFDITKFKDTFIEKLKKAIKTKRPAYAKQPSPRLRRPGASAGRAPTTSKKRKKKEDLIDALKGSLRAPARVRTPAYARTAKTVGKKASTKKRNPSSPRLRRTRGKKV